MIAHCHCIAQQVVTPPPLLALRLHVTVDPVIHFCVTFWLTLELYYHLISATFLPYYSIISTCVDQNSRVAVIFVPISAAKHVGVSRVMIAICLGALNYSSIHWTPCSPGCRDEQRIE